MPMIQSAEHRRFGIWRLWSLCGSQIKLAVSWRRFCLLNRAFKRWRLSKSLLHQNRKKALDQWVANLDNYLDAQAEARQIQLLQQPQNLPIVKNALTQWTHTANSSPVHPRPSIKLPPLSEATTSIAKQYGRYSPNSNSRSSSGSPVVMEGAEDERAFVDFVRRPAVQILVVQNCYKKVHSEFACYFNKIQAINLLPFAFQHWASLALLRSNHKRIVEALKSSPSTTYTY